MFVDDTSAIRAIKAESSNWVFFNIIVGELTVVRNPLPQSNNSRNALLGVMKWLSMLRKCLKLQSISLKIDQAGLQSVTYNRKTGALESNHDTFLLVFGLLMFQKATF